MVKIVDGSLIAKEILSDLKKKFQKLDVRVRLGIVNVASNKETLSFLNKKKQAGDFLGVKVKIFKYPPSISSRQLRGELYEIKKQFKPSGLLVQLPLPETINTPYILNAIPRNLDVDVLSSAGFGAFATQPRAMKPPVVQAVLEILEHHKIDIAGAHVVLVGKGRLAGLPLAIGLSQLGSTVTITHSRTREIFYYTKQGDVVITGAGKKDLLREDSFKKSAVLIDIGGDVSAGVKKSRRLKLLSPHKGGIGPITVAMLYKNLLRLVGESRRK